MPIPIAFVTGYMTGLVELDDDVETCPPLCRFLVLGQHTCRKCGTLVLY